MPVFANATHSTRAQDRRRPVGQVDGSPGFVTAGSLVATAGDSEWDRSVSARADRFAILVRAGIDENRFVWRGRLANKERHWCSIKGVRKVTFVESRAD
jgi:hypothetical protein